MAENMPWIRQKSMRNLAGTQGSAFKRIFATPLTGTLKRPNGLKTSRIETTWNTIENITEQNFIVANGKPRGFYSTAAAPPAIAL